MRVALGTLLICLCGCNINIPTLNSIILRPNLNIEKTPLDWGYEYEEFTLPIDETRSVVGWHIPSAESKALLVILPGSDANKSLYAEGIPIYNPSGYDLLVADYEGFGTSPGVPDMAACVDDTIAIMNYAMTRHSKVFVYGVSLGAPLATYAAANYPVKGLMLEASFIPQQEAELWLRANGSDFPFMWDLANLYIYPQVPEQYDIIKYIQQVAQPKLIMHSVEDTLTPYESGIRVFDASPEPKEFWQMRGDHGLMVRKDPQAYIDKVTGWLDAHLDQ